MEMVALFWFIARFSGRNCGPFWWGALEMESVSFSSPSVGLILLALSFRESEGGGVQEREDKY